MGFQESPSLEDFSNGLHSELPDPSKKRKGIWSIIAVLSLIVIVLLVITFFRSGGAAVVAGTGTITGIVLGEQNQPVEAEIIVLGTEIEGMANSEGYFEISNIPAGHRSVAVIYEASGWDFPTKVNPGQVTHMGELRFTVTAEPDN
jgi:hypothetical protein